MKIIPRSFYARDTVTVARDLLGQILVRKINGKLVSGVILETEAYGYKDDEASHSFGGRTERNKAMFGEVGKAYVYFTYGMHYCVNAVARDDDAEAGAVLFRALYPKTGMKFMMKMRKINDISNLTNGPAKLTRALQITKDQYGLDLATKSSLFIIEGQKIPDRLIETRPRIGIKKATRKKWNFRISENNF